MSAERVKSLDGLRGIAALVVVLNHAMVTGAVFANVADARGRAESGTASWWLSYTPLHLLWGGTEAVFIFFVLSGYVLASLALREGFSWTAYYPQRLTRLYLPVWGSLLVAAVSATLIERREISGASWWVNGHHDSSSFWGTIHSALLLDGVDFLNNPLWSLVWEMWFSILLPLYLIVAVWTSRGVLRLAGVVAGLGLIMIAGSAVDHNALRYMPMFAFGVLLFVERDRFDSLARKIYAVPGAWWLTLAGALTLLSSYWMAQASPAIPDAVASISRAAQLGGALLLVFVAVHWTAARRLLERPWVLWLGSRSFSLYLTHDAVVISTTMVTDAKLAPWQTILIAVPIALLLAEVFFRAIERPSHNLSKKLRRTPVGA